MGEITLENLQEILAKLENEKVILNKQIQDKSRIDLDSHGLYELDRLQDTLRLLNKKIELVNQMLGLGNENA
jgi:hypothetical protein